ncbi:hypothetical protein [Caldisalinibacter kiritimatiensis]|uniref:Uncharacterized protein n=1 Tax=Caldisalinibacter kiritimatiensis TaxID=1304284 RepID=R1AYU7_9FIRM|nr:hypothetical protein [Caldisalinibacter kiritimatiensis]EOD01882.1 hypothetical protein L21TH_0043 [Caldisalinibacter kiritimatiensis]
MDDILQSLFKFIVPLIFIIIGASSKNKKKNIDTRNKRLKNETINTVSKENTKSSYEFYEPEIEKYDYKTEYNETYQNRDYNYIESENTINNENEIYNEEYIRKDSLKDNYEKIKSEDIKNIDKNTINEKYEENIVKDYEINVNLSSKEEIIKGIIMSEILSKPKSLRKR